MLISMNIDPEVRFNVDFDHLQTALEEDRDITQLFSYLADLVRHADVASQKHLPFNSVHVTPLVNAQTKIISYHIRSALQLEGGGELGVHDTIVTPQYIGSASYEKYGVRNQDGSIILDDLGRFKHPVLVMGMLCLGEELIQ